MPPAAVKTIRDQIFWQYAKIISESAGEGKNNYGFIMDRFKKTPVGCNAVVIIHQGIREGARKPERLRLLWLKWEPHTGAHAPEISRWTRFSDNAVWVCAECNSRKGSKRLYEWFGLENRNVLPRIAEGKYLKLLYSLHESRGTLGATSRELCSACDMGAKCPVKEKLSVYCLEGNFLKT